MVEEKVISESSAWAILESIPDPDIPVLSIVELGLVRKVEVHDHSVNVTITPSYSGCPAMHFFRQEIEEKLKEHGFGTVKIEVALSPAWTTDWLSESAKSKMKAHGIAPPDGTAELDRSTLKSIECPWCRSHETQIRSQFGSTPCKALWFCNACHQPFEYFKCY